MFDWMPDAYIVKTYRNCYLYSEETFKIKEWAFSEFWKKMDSRAYDLGHLLDINTGELLAYFANEKDGNGVKTTFWVANAAN